MWHNNIQLNNAVPQSLFLALYGKVTGAFELLAGGLKVAEHS